MVTHDIRCKHLPYPHHYLAISITISPMMASMLTALWRYPIKSMLGEVLQTATIQPRGVRGDRVYALQDVATGNIVSAKNPRKWGKLFDLQASFVEPSAPPDSVPQVRIRFPDGKIVTTTQPNGDAILSDYLGREVTLILAPPPMARREIYWADVAGQAYQDLVTDSPFRPPANTFFDFGAIHILTTNTLRHLQHLYPTGQFAVERFRPNLVIEVPSEKDGFIENEWVGRTLYIGKDVKLRLLIPTPRCVVTTLPQGNLPQDVGILKTAVAHNFLEIGDYGNFACVGGYIEVIQGGRVAVGDVVRLESSGFPGLKPQG